MRLLNKNTARRAVAAAALLTMTAASGGNREELLGPRPAGCKRQRSRRWEPQPGLVERSETERLDEGQPDRKPLTFGHSETGDAVCLYIICPMTAA